MKLLQKVSLWYSGSGSDMSIDISGELIQLTDSIKVSNSKFVHIYISCTHQHLNVSEFSPKIHL